MNHFAGLETVDLQGEFAQALLANAPSEAVVVGSRTTETPTDPPDRPREWAGRRASVVLFRVGGAFVAEIVDDEGPSRLVGLAPSDARRYLDRVGRDEVWTVLWVEGDLAPDHGGPRDTEAAAGPS